MPCGPLRQHFWDNSNKDCLQSNWKMEIIYGKYLTSSCVSRGGKSAIFCCCAFNTFNRDCEQVEGDVGLLVVELQDALGGEDVVGEGRR